MSDNYWNSSKFKTLNKEWSEKLKKSGFDDIEQENGSLKRWTSTYIAARYRPQEYEAKELYYRLAGQFLNEHNFDNEFQYKVWAQHANGVSIRDIVKFFKTSSIRIGRVNSTIKKLMTIMKKKYLITTENLESMYDNQD